MSQGEDQFATKLLTNAYDYLAPDGSEIRLLLEVGGGGLAHCRLPEGGVSRAVRHKTVEEIWYFLSGRGEVWRKQSDLEETVEVMQGTSITIPTGASFQFRNTAREPLCFVIATIPRWPGAEEAEEVRGKWQGTTFPETLIGPLVN